MTTNPMTDREREALPEKYEEVFIWVEGARRIARLDHTGKHFQLATFLSDTKGQYLVRVEDVEKWSRISALATEAKPEARDGFPVGITMPYELNHHTKQLVVLFAQALAEKLYKAEQKYGYSDGWRNNDWMDECRQKLMEHIAKGDPRDVAAYCAFLWHHGESTAPTPTAGWNDALEEAAKLCELWNTSNGINLAKEIRALKSQPPADTVTLGREEYEALKRDAELAKDNLRHMIESRENTVIAVLASCVRACEELADDALKANGVSDPYNDGYYAGAYDAQMRVAAIRDAARTGKDE